VSAVYGCMSSESLFLSADVTDGVHFVLLVPRSCATGSGFRLVSLQVAFGGLASSGLCSVWLLFSVPIGLCSCAASSTSDVF
jgi:hypothetical protein